AATRRRILAWIAALLPVSLLPVALGLLGTPYAVLATLLGAGFAAAAVALWRHPSAQAARRLFLVSVLYLMGTLAAMVFDLAWKVIAGVEFRGPGSFRSSFSRAAEEETRAPSPSPLPHQPLRRRQRQRHRLRRPRPLRRRQRRRPLRSIARTRR